MNVETIGLWAGAVWNSLNDANGTQDMKGLKKVTKLKEKEILLLLVGSPVKAKLTWLPMKKASRLKLL